MKRFLCAALLLALVLTGCAGGGEREKKQYTATFLNLFDTVTSITGLADSEADFRAKTQAIHDELLVYHQFFDIYNDYDGVNNLKTVNDNAGIAPVTVDPVIIDLLSDCRSYYDLTGGMVDVTMGSLLQLWHEARNDSLDDPANAYVPALSDLEKAAMKRGWEHVIIDEAASTVYIDHPEIQLDVGAVAKGWATQRVAENAPKGLLISVGGNVCACGTKDETGTPWVVGIQSPDSDDYLHTLYVTGGSVVTSGDYQRCYLAEGKIYHHIIDPSTCYPGTLWRSVTILCDDSGMADALSTALFLLPLEQGMALAQKCGAHAFWVDASGAEYMTPDFESLIRT